MSRRLVKIAKELNVGTTTIVEHLTNRGFDIENKPTANITDEMYNELLREFSKSIAIKEKADQLVIGTRPTQVKKDTPVSTIEKTAPEAPQNKEQKPAAKPVTETTEETIAEKPAERVKLKPSFKVVGKIDLESRLKPKVEEPQKVKEQEPEKEVEKESKVQEVIPPVQTTEQAASTEEKAPEQEVKTPEKEQKIEVAADVPTPIAKTPEAPEKPAEEKPKEEVTTPESGDTLLRAETPELRGLKILGKIDTDKFTKAKKKKKPAEKPAEAKKTDAAPAATGSDKKTDSSQSAKPSDTDAQNKRKKRKRKKISTEGENRPGTGQQRPGGKKQPGGKKEDEAKDTVSQKEIEEKIRSTIARISGNTGKKKRQKLRKENRERLREKQEIIDRDRENEKLQLTEFVTVSELASLLNIDPTAVITTCMNVGYIVSINQRLDAEIIEIVAEEFGHEVEFISVEEQTEVETEEADDPALLQTRNPIVTVMGHVDHGKTSLLDYIRNANVAGDEAGGITQHIGAYEVKVGDRAITFLDTPGHEAFTAMRARGAKVTDIAIIIIAADDKIMPQTKEAISHAQAAGVPMVFAINKVDKAGADPERIKGELAGMNLQVEDWGGSYQSQDISAKTGLGVDELLQKVILAADMEELKANPDRRSMGTVLEASKDKGRGYLAKILVQNGTLTIGDTIVAGEFFGKIKAMYNERGQRVTSAGPSTPVMILGLGGAPQAGERFKETETEQEAKAIASKRAQIVREQSNRAAKRISLDEIGRRLALGTFKELNLIVKGDVDGSIEALSDSLIKLSQETVQVNVIHKAVGQIIESDVLLASASDAIIIGFQVRPSPSARKLAEKEGVQIKMYSIIYEAIEEIKKAIEGMLEPDKEERITSQIEVRQVYKISKVGTIAGCYVLEGKINRNSNIRLIRDGIVVYPTREGVVGEIASLKRFKEDAKEVKSGMECGLSIKNFNDIKVGDIVEGYEVVEVKQKLK